jgi:hypothetical protein
MIRHWVSAVFRGDILYTFFTLLILLLPLGYSPLLALTCRTMPLHFYLSFTNCLHLLTRNFTFLITENKYVLYTVLCGSQWPRRLKAWVCGRLLAGIADRIPPAAWMSVYWKCCVLSGSGLCVGLITRPDESYRLWCLQWVWSRSPVTTGLHPESVRRATDNNKKIPVL